MEIQRINSNTPVKRDKPAIGEKKSFAQSFSFAKEKKNDEQLKKMLDEIKKKGNRLSITKCYADVRSYKNMIKEYLESVLNYMYNVKKDISFWQTQYFITVDVIDTKLEELTEALLENQGENIDVASTIDEI